MRRLLAPGHRRGGQPASAFVRADADANVVCPSFWLAEYAAKKAHAAYAYLFDYWIDRIRFCDVSADVDDNMHNLVSPHNCTVRGECGEVGWASHCTELPFLWGTEQGAAPWDSTRILHCPFSKPERELSDRMQGFWRSFFATGRPADATRWPPVPAAGDFAAILLDHDGAAPSHDAIARRKADCDFWRPIILEDSIRVAGGASRTDFVST